MKPIVTLTPNPAIDASCEADQVVPLRKIRTGNDSYDPGGGGINAARVIRELGGEAFAVYLAGGLTGDALDGLMRHHGVPFHRVRCAGMTRVSHAVFERRSGQEFRFTPEGPAITAGEWREMLAFLELLDLDLVVASGSLPPGLPQEAWLEVAETVHGKGGRLVVDTSGPALRSMIEAGCYLAKPNLAELETLLGRPLREPAAVEGAARELVDRGRVELLAVSLGKDGALLAGSHGVTRLAAPAVPVRSAVGAGDSFLAAMALALSRGTSPPDSLAWAVAAGAAAVLTPGTSLCRRADVESLHREIAGGRAGSPAP
ncbi:1-phosphofructokinase family hexose kinase [Marinimicrococcus flavescens]|uniref:Phosphofructokinase n=1 Tax=Marinimicrococcus flavescens TaxID=3031815 RepID=A0AAP3XRQ8_9PROT|nr:1-phosphofructokinase family hexose kinase [Marinimicrococcus flavescens]